LPYDARIKVTIETDDDALNNAIAEFKDYIAQEVLASPLDCGPAGEGAKVVEIEGSEVRLSVVVG
ncbi:MAG: DUF5915 domain-containing protein, partial [Prosthecobacter sp.]|nr:DUF5915 domain-containing protein [Prosthecobacter sp.]